jgi:cytidylate kinase
MIVAIDGPAGAGKSSVSKKLASELGFEFLDTGAMYRAVVLAGLQGNWDFADTAAVAAATSRLDYEYRGSKVFVNGSEVTDEIRLPEISRRIHEVADNPQVRGVLVDWQRDWARGKELVTEGRDQGTVVFPDAECKIFLTATETERGRRRWWELQRQGQDVTLEQVLMDQADRDQRDAQRPVGALKQATDAFEMITDGMTLDEVVQQLTTIVESKRPV